MILDIKRLLISFLIVCAVNAACVLLIEFLIGNALAEVIASSVICMLWLGYAAVSCRKSSDRAGKES